MPRRAACAALRARVACASCEHSQHKVSAMSLDQSVSDVSGCTAAAHGESCWRSPRAASPRRRADEPWSGPNRLSAQRAETSTAGRLTHSAPRLRAAQSSRGAARYGSAAPATCREHDRPGGRAGRSQSREKGGQGTGRTAPRLLAARWWRALAGPAATEMAVRDAGRAGVLPFLGRPAPNSIRQGLFVRAGKGDNRASSTRLPQTGRPPSTLCTGIPGCDRSICGVARCSSSSSALERHRASSTPSDASRRSSLPRGMNGFATGPL